MEKTSIKPLHSLITNAKLALIKVEARRSDSSKEQPRLRDDADYLLYSIANSLLALVELKMTRGGN